MKRTEINREELVRKLQAFLKESAGESAQITGSGSLKDFGIDSFKTIELILYLENRFGLPFPEEAYTSENLKSIDTIIDCVMKYQGKAK
jgi:acyl carrier protein